MLKEKREEIVNNNNHLINAEEITDKEEIIIIKEKDPVLEILEVEKFNQFLLFIFTSIFNKETETLEEWEIMIIEENLVEEKMENLENLVEDKMEEKMTEEMIKEIKV